MTQKQLMELICQLGQLHIEGNIVPPSWYQHLKYPSGKPYHIAITLLSEIVYWFRPRMVRDERTGEFAGWAKKFRGDGIQRSYAAWGAPFGFTKRESADAIKYLLAENLITTEIRDVVLPDGTLRPNVVVVTSVDPVRLREITYSRRGGHTPESTTQTPSEGSSVETEEVVPQDVIPTNGYDISTSDLLPRPVPSSPDAAREGATPGRNNIESNLETIRETTTENSYLPGSNSTTGSASAPAEDDDVCVVTKTATPPAAVNVPATVVTTPAQAEVGHPLSVTPTGTGTAEPAAKSPYPAVLLKPKARRAVLELGQRPARDDLAYPNVAAACAWTARMWNLPLVLELSETAEVSETLSALESALAGIRERALREKQLTFTQVLDDYLGDDEALRALLRDTPTPLSRLSEFAQAIADVLSQWDDAPTADVLAALRATIGQDGAAA